jgi:hypothetical protein
MLPQMFSDKYSLKKTNIVSYTSTPSKHEKERFEIFYSKIGSYSYIPSLARRRYVV